MSTPNPLIPQGTFQSQAAKGASNVRIAVATIVAIHLVFFGGLLLQGCKRDTKTGAGSGDTNAAAASAATNLSLPPMTSDSMFYTNANSLPSEPTNGYAGQARSNLNLSGDTSMPGATATPGSGRDSWQSTNLGGTLGSQTADQSTGGTKEYTVVPRDTFDKIAKANGTTVAALKKANPNVDPAKIRPGMKLNVPASGNAGVSTQGAGTESTASAANASGNLSSSGNSYTVKPGDTLTKIAKSHGVTVSQLRNSNNLKTSRVNVGQKLKIPARGEAGSETNAVPKKAAATRPHKQPATNTHAASTNGSANLSL